MLEMKTVSNKTPFNDFDYISVTTKKYKVGLFEKSVVGILLVKIESAIISNK